MRTGLTCSPHCALQELVYHNYTRRARCKFPIFWAAAACFSGQNQQNRFFCFPIVAPVIAWGFRWQLFILSINFTGFAVCANLPLQLRNVLHPCIGCFCLGRYTIEFLNCCVTSSFQFSEVGQTIFLQVHDRLCHLLEIENQLRNIFRKITIKKPCIYCGTRLFCFDERLNFITWFLLDCR